jgi:hypothetical protein
VARWPARTEIARPKLILCEGPADEAFLRALISARQLGDPSIRNTSDGTGDRSGSISRFGTLLTAIPAFHGFAQVTDILIIADADEDPPANFAQIQRQIESAENPSAKPPRYASPTALRETAGHAPSITVLLLPWDNQKGNLESLCLDAAMSADHAIAQCVEEFATCTGTNWPEVTLSGKMKLRSLLAARHRPNPFIGMGNIWSNAPDLVPLSHSSFNQLSDFLRDFLA